MASKNTVSPAEPPSADVNLLKVFCQHPKLDNSKQSWNINLEEQKLAVTHAHHLGAHFHRNSSNDIEFVRAVTPSARLPRKLDGAVKRGLASLLRRFPVSSRS
jgi:hypothetical protein